ncbi:MAG TPA: hypothetical protein VHQ41_00030 [Patescibacteria group bacterium]|jgi:hypothetical protein|nr:hypothetical protein [Patescibacteria group bacterium]
MAELETQVVKIQLGDNKQATSYVYTAAETVDTSGVELYMICEMPLFNPAAAQECQRIAEAIAASLRRSYRRPATNGTFENALAVINEELGKLQNIGKTHWLGKLNAVIAVKSGTKLSVTSVGKITALLQRDGNFAPIAEPGTPHHPLKTFENFSEGKIRLGDLLVLSTSQLFNHISIDRFKNILKRNDLPDAAEEVIATLSDVMGPEVACGTILAKQVPAGSMDLEEETDLGAYMAAPQVASSKQSTDWLDRIKTMSATAVTIGKNVGGSVKEKIKKRPRLTDMVKGRDGALQVVQSQFKKVTKQVQPETIKGYSRQKKIFMIAAAILLVAVITNVAIAKYVNNKPKVVAISDSDISAMEKLASDANAALLYGDESQANNLLSELKNKLNGLAAVPDNQKSKIDSIRDQANALDAKLNNVAEAKVESLGTLGNGGHLISVPGFLATESSRTIVSYNKSTKSVSDSALKTSEPITMSGFNKGSQAVIFNGSELLLWDFKTGIVGGGLSDSVPNSDNARGLTVYNGKAYILDRGGKKIMKYSVGDSAITAPTASLENIDELANASDITIDGNIYIATNGTILKYNSGAKQEFNVGVSNLPDTTKIYTENGFANLYVLDPAGKRILVLSKAGAVIQTLTNGQFNDLKDFSVDEKGKAIYVLNNNQLLKVSF